ncbi:winged helix-turn-helix domain-containing protein [Actinomadura sp. ATCC 31491]|uniref:Winged helix-turn-helix domain-containing protein n=1 Tax=Actinomadura luzonensis TaxID=2805427 RepID=A0ABT0G5S8_9ACTN|nr:winged helix-turn-helix domain-containing protein [Actinomadura luzonensis]MCK2219738.1 winged helix-turn-helix domain-containing protein [Actinomadura luzonensis]
MTPPPVRIDALARRAYLGDQPLQLGPLEYAALACLAANAGEIVTPDALARHLDSEDTAVRQLIYNLRKKLGDTLPHTYVKSVYGRGWLIPFEMVVSFTCERFEVAGRQYEAISWDRRPSTAGTHSFVVTAREVTG